MWARHDKNFQLAIFFCPRTLNQPTRYSVRRQNVENLKRLLLSFFLQSFSANSFLGLKFHTLLSICIFIKKIWKTNYAPCSRHFEKNSENWNFFNFLKMAEYFFVLVGGWIASMLTNKTPQFFFISMHVQKIIRENNFIIFFKISFTK